MIFFATPYATPRHAFIIDDTLRHATTYAICHAATFIAVDADVDTHDCRYYAMPDTFRCCCQNGASHDIMSARAVDITRVIEQNNSRQWHNGIGNNINTQWLASRRHNAAADV